MNYNTKAPPARKNDKTRHSQFEKLGISANGYPAKLKMTTTMAAFTLVEMSIVLIIIGLIIAGIVKGKEMMHVAKRQTILKQAEKFEIAIRLFDDKYDYLPGDLPNATDYWPNNSQWQGYSTNNGNGNRVIDGSTELVCAWQHLMSAGFLDKKYSGRQTSGSPKPGINVPQSSFHPKAGYIVNTWIPFSGRSGHYLRFAQPNGSDFYGPVLSPTGAYFIDKKVDDGEPEAGKIFFGNGKSPSGIIIPGCTSGAAYLLNNTGELCVMFKYIGF